MKFKRNVTHAGRMVFSWYLELECQHVTHRRIRKRFAIDSRSKKHQVVDPPPSWVYCEVCQKAMVSTIGFYDQEAGVDIEPLTLRDRG
jgi:hypothetical protein